MKPQIEIYSGPTTTDKIMRVFVSFLIFISLGLIYVSAIDAIK